MAKPKRFKGAPRPQDHDDFGGFYSSLHQHDNYFTLKGRGLMPLSGRAMIGLHWDKNAGYLYHDECSRPLPTIMARLEQFGLRMFGKDAADRILRMIAAVTDFTPVNMLDHSGRHDSNYGFLDGTVFSPKDTETPICAYVKDERKHRISGNVADFKNEVLDVVRGNPLLQFATMVSLAAGLCEVLGEAEPIIFEIVAPRSAGAADLQLVAAAVQGNLDASMCPFSALSDEPEKLFERSRGGLLLLGDPGLALGADAPTKRQSTILLGVNSLLDRTSGTKTCLITSHRSLADWAGCDTEVGRCALQFVTTLKIADDRRCGVYESVTGCELPALRAKLQQAIQNFHGAPYRAFVQHVIDAVHTDEKAFKEIANKRIEQFVRRSGININDSLQYNKLRQFGLVYAAADFAQQAKVLPADWRCGPIIMQCYRRHCAQPVDNKPIEAILEKIAGSALRLDDHPKPSLEALRKASAYVRGYGRKRKLFVRQTALDQYPALASRLYEETTKARLLKPDPVSSKQRLGKLGLVRVYAFTVPENEVD